MKEAGVSFYVPPEGQEAYRCEQDHILVELTAIEPPRRNPGFALDENGFRRDRMLRVLVGIREDHSIPPIEIEDGDAPYAYRLRDGVHRFYASIACGFSHLPCDVVPRL
ncbi:hypothetical protein [Bradyrhizobium sp. AZCC 2230]|uniref:hypothetical protein n=1 Tax=Bradyrhizobium sp. AZCC 2230 TaxID=3117021 RepID=UPI002FF3E958